MSEETRARAEAALKEVETITTNLLPEPKGEVVPADAADPATRAEIDKRKAEIDLSSTQSIIRFGSAAQAELQAISQEMLSGVRNKDVGPAGDSLREMVTSLRGFSVDELDPNRKRSWWERLTGSAEPVAEFMARYEDVQGQIDKVTGELLVHEHTLLKDIKSLDKLYEKTLAFYDELALYIAAGEAKIAELDRDTIPAREAAVAGRAGRAGGDGGAGAPRPARGPRRPRAAGARPQADPAGDDAVAALDPAGAGERQEPGDQDQLDAGQHRAAVGDPARPGGDDPPRARGGGRGQGGERPDERAPDQERREPAAGQCRDPRARPSAGSSTSRRCRRRTTT